MTAQELLSQLREKGVEVRTSGDDRLVIDAPKGTITEDLRSALSAHKTELLQILKAEQTGNGAGAAATTSPRETSAASVPPSDATPIATELPLATQPVPPKPVSEAV